MFGLIVDLGILLDVSGKPPPIKKGMLKMKSLRIKSQRTRRLHQVQRTMERLIMSSKRAHRPAKPSLLKIPKPTRDEFGRAGTQGHITIYRCRICLYILAYSIFHRYVGGLCESNETGEGSDQRPEESKMNKSQIRKGIRP